jgi:hypothetical protein
MPYPYTPRQRTLADLLAHDQEQDPLRSPGPSPGEQVLGYLGRAAETVADPAAWGEAAKRWGMLGVEMSPVVGDALELTRAQQAAREGDPMGAVTHGLYGLSGPVGDLAGMAAKGLAPLAALGTMRVHHGTPHVWEGAPDLARIGTGEGAQAFGHGLYFAENPETARHYFTPGDGRGGVYELDLDVDPDDLLSWDAPLRSQSEPIRERVLSLAARVNQKVPDFFDLEKMRAEGNVTGAQLYDILQVIFDGPEGASRAMQEAGIPGLRYLDQGSRLAGQGTHNVVIWDQEVLDRSRIIEPEEAEP